LGGLQDRNSLILFNFNTIFSLRNIEVYLTLTEGTYLTSVLKDTSQHDLIRYRQYIVLDCITKLQTIIESLMVLLYSLSKGYTSVSEILSHYDPQMPRQITEMMIKGNFNKRKALGLPNPTKLHISHQEREVILKVLYQTERYMTNRITNLAKFYDRYRIIFGKWKHGLTFESGGALSDFNSVVPMPTGLENSLLIAYDRKTDLQMPENYIIGYSNDGSIDGWYNVETIIKFGSHLLEEINDTMEDLKEVISYVTKNHITYALNCGEGYVPYFESKKDVFSPWLFAEETLSPPEKTMFESIMYKIMENMNMSPSRLNILKVIDNTIIESISNNSITNILFKFRK
jgi:hypothetical protein